MKLVKQIGLSLLVGALCISGIGCAKRSRPLPLTATQDQVIIPHTTLEKAPITYTPVYATSFGDTVILATVPVDEWNSLEPDCEPREISNGGRIKCNGEHESKVPITKVLVLEDLIPRVCSGWFRDMIYLESIEGANKILTHEVSDMSYMFAGCEKLEDLDLSSWDVSKVQDMTNMFMDCASLDDLPDWYE